MSIRAWALAALTIAAPARAADPATDLAAVIDQHLAADWAARGVVPAAPADDAEFCRRVYLDLVGRTPRVAETLDFLDDKAPDKRAKLVDRLLGTAPHAAHFAAVTRAAWLPQTVAGANFAGFGFQLETWLRNQYRENVPADRTVRALLEVPYQVQVSGSVGNTFRFVQATGTDPDRVGIVGFYQANEAKAENVAAAVSRLFVGVKLECAQCHDHPFAPYTKEQFWEFAAFFADLNRVPTADTPPGPQGTKNRIQLPNSSQVVVAKFFDGSSPEWNEVMSPRQELAAWLTSRQNPYFARNLANRMWAHFFGVGVTDPVDEPGEANPPSHPELLDALGKAFAAGNFDNRLLVRAITRTKAYQLSSRMSHPTQADPRRFARMSVRGLTPAQLFDSLVSATGYRESAQLRANNFAGFVQPGNPRSLFLNRFTSTDRPTEASTTILQALMLMNGQFLDAQTAPDTAELLGAVADIPGWDTKRRVETLFLAALARRPTADELERFSSHVERGDRRKGLGDVFWVLLNSPEFLFNH
ncbi:MAG: DUF1553 domain-containing protein [Gemmataceae bacterium]